MYFYPIYNDRKVYGDVNVSQDLQYGWHYIVLLTQPHIISITSTCARENVAKFSKSLVVVIEVVTLVIATILILLNGYLV